MKDLINITDGVVDGLTSDDAADAVYAKTTTRQMNVTQKQAVKYFFARLQRVYQAEYRRQMPDENTARGIKQEFAHLIMDLSKEVMDSGFDNLHEERKLPNSEYKFLNLDAVIELVKNGRPQEGVQAGAYKPFFPNGRRLEEPVERRSRRKQAAEDGLSRIKSLFDE